MYVCASVRLHLCIHSQYVGVYVLHQRALAHHSSSEMYKLVCDGAIEKAMTRVHKLDPTLLSREPLLHFRLWLVEFRRRALAHDHDGALCILRQHLGMTNHHLKGVVWAIAFSEYMILYVFIYLF